MEVHGTCAVLVISLHPFEPVFLPATLASARSKCRRAGISLSVATVLTLVPCSYCVPSLLVHLLCTSHHLATCRCRSSLPV